MSPEAAEKLRQILEEPEEELKPFKIFTKNWPIFLLWLRVDHLWNYGAMGGVISLNWPAVYAKIQLLVQYANLELSIEMVEGIEIIERAALKILNQKD